MGRFRFVGRRPGVRGDRYIWERPMYGNDSRVEQISCSVDWFWGAR
jgi:hypothetical protein